MALFIPSPALNIRVASSKIW